MISPFERNFTRIMTNLFSTSVPNSSYISIHPSSEGSTCELDDTALSIPLAFWYSLIFVFGLGGNLLALWVFFFIHGKKNSVRVFLVNIAIADLFLVICLPFRVVYHSHHNTWTLGRTFCKVVGNVFYMNMYISITLLGFIGIDRYIKVHRAAGSRFRQKSTWSTVACVMVWALSIATTVPMAAVSEGSEDPDKCFQYKKKQGAEWKAYLNYSLVALFWLVFLTLVISYGKIAFKLLGNSRQNPDFPNALQYNRTAKKSFFVLFLFTVCFVPYHTFRSIYIYSQIHETSCSWNSLMDRTNEIVLLFSTFNSCLDPVMFFLLSGSVRRSTLQILNNFLHLPVNRTSAIRDSTESHTDPRCSHRFLPPGTVQAGLHPCTVMLVSNQAS
ncbi:probable G-protein coupled receptor 34 [Anguilla rostrata]|uniref:probable G-protein coupled receptor 34 n=1 Tax=Anguilla rostrata TaxID=7938 RepID=UPI0030D54FC8